MKFLLIYYRTLSCRAYSSEKLDYIFMYSSLPARVEGKYHPMPITMQYPRCQTKRHAKSVPNFCHAEPDPNQTETLSSRKPDHETSKPYTMPQTPCNRDTETRYRKSVIPNAIQKTIETECHRINNINHQQRNPNHRTKHQEPRRRYDTMTASAETTSTRPTNKAPDAAE